MTFCRPLFALGLVLAILAGGCAAPKTAPKPKPVEKKPLAAGKHILMIVPQSNFSDKEFKTLQSIFASEGAEIRLAAPRATTADGVNGLLLPADISLELVDTAAYDAVVFIGGKGASTLFRNKDAFTIARQAVAQKKILGATGTATLVLGLAGVLEGKQATAPPRLARSFAEVAKCTYTGKPVQTDGNIITASGAEACDHFARTMLEKMQ